MTASLESIRRGLDDLRARIAATASDPSRVEIVAVTKGHGASAVRAALDAGLAEIGENYADELLAKAEEIEGTGHIRWNYLGAVQRNKVRRLAPIVSCWQSVARVSEAESIAARTEGRTPEIFVEVDFSGDPGRPGCSPDAAASVVNGAAEAGCRVRGLMTVAPLVGDEWTRGGSGGVSRAARQREVARSAFGRCAELAGRLGLTELSMGMTDDLEEAIAAGSTMIRVGTALFGPRPPRGPHGGPGSLQQ
jgi:pyridoxal phosphate enzyme (YggS family)